MSYGVTPQGFVRPSVRELLDERESDQLSTISTGLDQSPESVLGGLNSIACRQLGVAWEALEIAFNAFDPDRAEGFLQTALAKLTGTRREQATYSLVDVIVQMDDGTELVAGEHFAHVEGKPGIRFTPVENIVADAGDGTYDGVFRAEDTGPVAAPAGDLVVIATAVSGWNWIVNTDDATLGQVADSDAALRARREEQLAAAGSQTAAAIRADVRQLGPWIKAVDVIENETLTTDSGGRPGKSFEVLIFDETAPPDADNQVAQAIWNNKPGGIQSYGDASEQGTAIDDLGNEQIVPFSRVTVVNINIVMVLSVAPGFTDYAGVKTYIAEQGNLRYDEPGMDVIALFVRSLPLDVEGVLDVTGFAIDTSGPPVGAGNITIGEREIARFDTSDMTIT